MNEKFTESCLYWHNKFRAMHGSPPLMLDMKLIDHSITRASNISTMMTKPDKMIYSENSWIGLMASREQYQSCDCKDAVYAWYGESRNYDYDRGHPRMGCSHNDIAHFANMMWKSSTSMGCAKKYSDNMKAIYVVCSYNPGYHLEQNMVEMNQQDFNINIGKPVMMLNPLNPKGIHMDTIKKYILPETVN